MANRRMIAGDIFEDDFIGGLDYFQRLLWIGMIVTVADDQGRMMDNPALIRSNIFLYDEVTDIQVETAVHIINVANKIERYIAGGKRLIQIINWWKYQTPAWASPSKFLPPPNWMDRAKYHAQGNKIVVTNWDKIGGYIAGYVPTIDRALNDGDVKGDGNGERRGEEGEGAGTATTTTPQTPSYSLPPKMVEEKIFCSVTNYPTIPNGELDAVINAIASISTSKGLDANQTIDYLRPFFREAKKRYPMTTKAFWLTDWAVAGTIPEPNGSKKTVDIWEGLR